MNKAQQIASLFNQRDVQIFEHLISSINSKLDDSSWLLSMSNYSRDSGNEIVYTLSVGEDYKNYIEAYERTWPSEAMRRSLVDYYTEQGFKVDLTDNNLLVLRVDGFDIGLVEDDENGAS